MNTKLRNKVNKGGSDEFYSCRHVADFETNTPAWGEDYARVWCGCICDVVPEGAEAHVRHFLTIQDFFRIISQHSWDEHVIYFHNIKFDGAYVCDYLLRSGYASMPWDVENDPEPGEFSCMVSAQGAWYKIKIHFTNGTFVTLVDSLKVFNKPVSKLPKEYGLKTFKGDLDYDLYRPVGYEPNEDEWSYVERDVLIVAHALYANYQNGLYKDTAASNAMSAYKELTGKKAYRAMFPELEPEVDEFCRRAYDGGITQVMPGFEEKEVGSGCSYDANSLYPSVMISDSPVPMGRPKHFEGEPPKDKIWIADVWFCFELKEGMPPCIKKVMNRYAYAAYAIESECLEHRYVTSQTWETVCSNYDVWAVEWGEGYYFESMPAVEMFGDYIDIWREKKENAGENKGQRASAKLQMNSLYGKFGKNPHQRDKIPVLYDECLSMEYQDEEEGESEYVPVAAFITSYAREELMKVGRANQGRVVYMDTDSSHLLGLEPIQGVPVDDNKFGCWKREGEFTRAIHIRPKTYIWDLNGEFEVKCAGMPDNIKEMVTWENFRAGFNNLDENGDIIPGRGKLTPKYVPGGMWLVDARYSINPVIKC